MFTIYLGFKNVCRVCGSENITLRTRIHNETIDMIQFICNECPNKEMFFPESVNGGYELCLELIEEKIYCPKE